MIGNPLALLGLVAVGLPILIHLLGRYRSRIERFPTLRFIGASRLNPTRRRRINDWPLLLVRIGIVALAAIALSQPRFRLGDAGPVATSRVVILDTSASVAPRGGMLPDSNTGNVDGILIQTAHPSEAMESAVAWLTTRTGLREIVLNSDFQRSSIDTADLHVPPGIGFSVALSAAKDPLVPEKQALPFAQGDIGVIAGPTDLAGVTAAWRAIGRTVPSSTAGRIALIYKGAPAADSLYRAATPIDSAWMAHIVAVLDRDSTLIAAGPAAASRPNARSDLDVVGSRAGPPAIVAGRNGDRLSLFVLADPGSLPSAALNAALARVTSHRVPASELDTAKWSAADLAPFERKAEPTRDQTSDTSDARWFWLASIALIILETWMRSRARTPAGVAQQTPAARERAA
jgi:hypothetical protein